MTLVGWAQIALVLALALGCAVPLSNFIADVYAGERNFLSPVIGPVERGFYRLAGVDPAREQGWFAYTMAMLAFSIAGFLSLYAMQRLQNVLPLNPQGFDGVAPDLAFNTVDQLRHQHQLAELWRRDDDEPSHPDARPHRAQFRFRGDRPRDGLRAGARLCALLGDDGRQFLGRSDPRHALRPAADLDRRRACPGRARRAADAGRRRSTRRRSKARSRPSRSGRWRARRRSRSSAPTAAASSTPIPPIRSRTRTPGRTSSRSGRFSLIPVASVLAFGRIGRRPAPGPGDPGRHGRLPHRRRRRRLLGGGRRQSDPRPRSASIRRPAISKARRSASARR